MEAINAIELEQVLSLDAEKVRAFENRLAWAQRAHEMNHFDFNDPDHLDCLVKIIKSDLREVDFHRNYTPSESDDSDD
jgi:hypothetical protein